MSQHINIIADASKIPFFPVQVWAHQFVEIQQAYYTTNMKQIYKHTTTTAFVIFNLTFHNFQWLAFEIYDETLSLSLCKARVSVERVAAGRGDWCGEGRHGEYEHILMILEVWGGFFDRFEAGI